MRTGLRRLERRQYQRPLDDNRLRRRRRGVEGVYLPHVVVSIRRHKWRRSRRVLELRCTSRSTATPGRHAWSMPSANRHGFPSRHPLTRAVLAEVTRRLAASDAETALQLGVAEAVRNTSEQDEGVGESRRRTGGPSSCGLLQDATIGTSRNSLCAALDRSTDSAMN